MDDPVCTGIDAATGWYQRDFQHRGFIDFSDSKGWWPVFCNVRPQDDSDASMDILKDYVEQPSADEKYIRWIENSFQVCIGLLSRWSLFACLPESGSANTSRTWRHISPRTRIPSWTARTSMRRR